MAFKDRTEAAHRLADRLATYRGRKPLVLAIPRGAVPMARIIADALEGELDIVLVHKIGAPLQPEYAIGSVSEAGDVYLGPDADFLGIEQSYLDGEVKAQLERLRRRRALYTPARAPIDPTGRILIVVDDGVATGWTMVAALRALRPQKPEKLVAAIGVAPPGAVGMMEREADEVICLETPLGFYAVGQFFRDFSEVTDEEVVAILASAPAAKEPAGGS